MSAYNSTITLEVWDGTYSFRLRTGEILKLQEAAAPDGPWAAFLQLRSLPRWDLVREVIRFGLIGGGRSTEEAARLVAKWVDDGSHPDESQVLAFKILGAWITGGTGLPEKKSPPAKARRAAKAPTG